MELLKVNLLSDKHDKALPPCTNLLEIKFENPQLRLYKRGIECGFTAFGLSITTLNSLEMLFHFVRQLKKAVSVYTDNPLIKEGFEAYRSIVKRRVKQSEQNKPPLRNTMFEKTVPRITVSDVDKIPKPTASF